MRKICVALVIALFLTSVPEGQATSTRSEIVARSALSKCLARAKKKKGAFARTKAIKACYAASRR